MYATNVRPDPTTTISRSKTVIVLNIALVSVYFNQFARVIVNANHSVM